MYDKLYDKMYEKYFALKTILFLKYSLKFKKSLIFLDKFKENFEYTMK